MHVLDGEIEKSDIMRRCRFLFERSPHPMVFVEGEAQITRYANPGFCRLVGRTGAELVGCLFTDAAPEEEEKAWTAILDRVYRTGEAESAARPQYAEKSRDSVSWPYTIWAVLDEEARSSGLMILLTNMAQADSEQQGFTKANEEIIEINQRLLITGIHAREVADEEQQAAVLLERNRMAQDIHDTLAQGFTGILLQLEAAAYAPEQEQARLHIAQARDLARQSLQEARRSVRALRPQALEGEQLPGALASLIRQTAATIAANVTFQVYGAARSLPAAVENHLFRIGQEALTNAIKHSEAAHIQVELLFEPTQTRLRVQDDGKGFEFQAGLQGDGFGLIGIYERAERIGGGITLDTHPGHGTSLTVTVPAPPTLTEEKRP